MQARLHAARPALCHRVRYAAVRAYCGDAPDDPEVDPSVPPALYPLVACVTVCLPRLEELFLDLDVAEQKVYPISILALLAGLPHLERLSVSYPTGAADIEVFQAGPAAG